jgi:ABC-2 type transport system ATP-binding protein
VQEPPHGAREGGPTIAESGRVATSPGDLAIAARGLRKFYRAQGRRSAKEALKGIDLLVPRGAIFGLLGPNGAGKSTFINILAGLVIKTAGTVEVWGFDIDRNPRNARAAIGVVPQELNIDPFFTPLELLELQAGLYGVPKRQRRTAEILAMVGLEDQANAYARTLSGGMRRRLLVAKAMVHMPPILVLDEPTAGVDIELRRQLWEAVRKLHARGTTIVLTTHYLEEAQELCDTIAIIDGGEVVACEKTPALLSRVEQKMLLIQPEVPLTAVPAALVGVGVDLKPDGRLAISYEPSRTSAETLLERVRGAGVRVRDLTTVEADLEDIFLQLTYRRAGRASTPSQS